MQTHNDAKCVKCGNLPRLHVAAGFRWKVDMLRGYYVHHAFVFQANGR